MIWQHGAMVGRVAALTSPLVGEVGFEERSDEEAGEGGGTCLRIPVSAAIPRCFQCRRSPPHPILAWRLGSTSPARGEVGAGALARLSTFAVRAPRPY
ncbi:hypothetical protein SAMN05519104_0965 [Rhizobiales bacterium GAS188]|nr:hypothetical protein SAMN05519104_0965 [Rhizobiales bacterium GAS188]